MKICQIYDTFITPARDSQGAERVCETLTRGLVELGHDVVMRIHPESVDSPAPVVKDIPEDCDILHFHQWEPQNIDYESFGIPYVVTIHGGGSETDPTWLQKTINNPHIICVSDFISRRLSCPAYVWEASDPKNFTYSDKKENYFLWIGGTDWGENKGIFSTIQLAKKLRFNLVIAGTGRNQQYIEMIKNLCDDKIKYVGPANGEKKADLLSKAKALILLTKIPDACPVVMGEALLSGTPVIASTNGGMPEVIQSGVGFACKNDQEVARAVLSIGKIKSEDCRKYAMDNLSHTASAKKHLKYYENMIKYGAAHAV